MEHELQNTIELLERTPAALNALLRGLPETWTESNEGENTWSVRAVVAHLIHGEEEDWIPRVRVILRSGEALAFTLFDREGYMRYCKDKTLAQLLDELARGARKGAGEFARIEADCEGSEATRTAPVVWRRDIVGTAGDMGCARPDAPAPDFTHHGVPISGGSRTMGRVSGRDAVHRSQRGSVQRR